MLNFKTKHLTKSKIIYERQKLMFKKASYIMCFKFSSKGGGDFISYAFLGICEAILRGGRDLFFCVEPHISIYFTDIKYFF